MFKTPLGAVAAAGLLAAGATSAGAAPPERDVVSLECDNGRSYEVVVNGNGSFTPGRIVGQTGVIVPVEFGAFEFEAVLPDGSTVGDFLEEGESKGGGNVVKRSPRPTVTCTFSQTFVLPEADEEFDLPAGTEVRFSGSVTGFLTGR